MNLFRKLFFLYIFIFFDLVAEQRPIAISLGTVCPVAGVLREKEIRTVAYPFDWVVVPFEGLYRVIENDFESFFLKENLIFQEGQQYDGVMDLDTQFVFYHDFPVQIEISDLDGIKTGKLKSNFLDFYESIYEKYLRRIKRLKKVLNSSKKVILIRYIATKEEAILLRNLIQFKYPSLDFSLVIITNTLEHKNWNEPHIQNYYIPIENMWNSNSKEWLNVFYETKLLKI